MFYGLHFDQIFHQIQTGILLNSPKFGNKWLDMFFFPLVIGVLGSIISVLRFKITDIIRYIQQSFRGIKRHAAKIDYEGTIQYLPYKTRVQLDLGMATFFYYIFNHMDEVKGLQYFRRIPDQQRDWAETGNNTGTISPQLFEEFFIAQDKIITLPSGIKIYPYMQSKNENDDGSSSLSKNTTSIKTTTYSITVVYDKYNDSDLNMKTLLEKYKVLKDEYLEYKDNRINNDQQFVYMFSSKVDERVYFDRYSINNEPKRMEHLWFPEKEDLVRNITEFTENKQFYYNIGRPYRKVILAHGEPGCGKTSFLMSLINMLKCNKKKYPRQLIHLKLDELTRKDLMNILFKETISVDNCSEVSVKIPFDRRIYYIEEIDGYQATHDRKNQEALEKYDNIDINELANIINNSNNNNNSSNNNIDTVKSISSDDSLINGSQTESTGSVNNKNSQRPNSEICHLMKHMMGPVNQKNIGKLGIQDILEALDGIPSIKNGEVIFMTTNHIEKIDPALIRPGRVNHLINFKKATRENTILQIEKYYNTKLPEKYHTDIKHEKWTPAQIDAFCDSSVTIEDLVSKLIE